MRANQRRAFEFVGSLLTVYGEYRTQKERQAYVVTVLYFGATGAVLTSNSLPKDRALALLLVGVGVATAAIASLVYWQIKNLRFAARMVGASVNVSSRWLEQPPSAKALATTPLTGYSQYSLPADVAEEFKKQSVRALGRAQCLVPFLIVVWGASVVAVLWWRGV